MKDMNFPAEICVKAQRMIDDRHKKAETQYENRRAEIERAAPEVSEVFRQAAGVSSELTRLIISKKGNFREQFERIKKNNTDAHHFIREILSAKGYPADYLEIKYTCPVCGDTGFTEEGLRCGCFTELAAKLSAEELNASANMPDCDFEHFSAGFYPKEKNDEGVIPFEKMQEIFNYCKNYAENFSLSSRSLLMLGKTGTGKTHLSLSVAKEVIKNGNTCVYGSVINFLRGIEKEHFGRAAADEDTFERLIACDLLILDDLGAENNSPFYESTTYNIINTRINLQKPVIISSNLSPSELGNKYNERIISRIFGVYKILRFYGNDIRQEKMLRGLV